MRIIEEEQLDFEDLMLMPQHSDMNSRKEVNLFREIKWTGNDGKKHSFTCIPLMAANMIGIGCPSVAKVLVQNYCICTMEKHYSFEQLDELFQEVTDMEDRNNLPNGTYRNLIFPTIGIKESFDVLKRLNQKWKLNGIVIDVPNAYIPKVLERTKEAAKLFPHAFLVVGNIVTSERAYTLLEAGAQCVKVNIGAGCFHGNMKVLTKNGLKRIKDIEENEYVLTHTGKFEKVINKFEFNHHKKIININGIKCTPDHKFYAAKNEDIDKITSENYKDYCIWIEAKDLDNSKYKLLKIN